MEARGVTFEGTGGKHPYRLRKAGARLYTIPAHRGLQTEINDIYIRAMCRNFGIDVEAFKRDL